MSESVQISSDEEEYLGESKQSNNDKIVYKQKIGKDVEIDTANLTCLEPEKYLNDDIIRIYCAYLLNELCSSIISPKVHIFDNIFYQKLDKIFDAKTVDSAGLKQLALWYDDVDIFDKHFLIFPICEHQHWFVIVVCYPSAVKNFCQDDSIEPAPAPKANTPVRRERIPGIIIMDSLGIKRLTVTMKVRDFLDYDWRARLREVKRYAHTDLADYFPELPRQKNAFDCGLYMLMYIRCFLSQPDYFYRLVRQGDKESKQILKDKIVECLRENSRDAIKEQIQNMSR